MPSAEEELRGAGPAEAPAGGAAVVPAMPPAPPAHASGSHTFLSLLWRRYLAQLSRHPLRTKCVTAGVVAAASDALGQRLSRPGPLALPRILKFAAFGALWSGPALHYWQRQVERLFASSRLSSLRAAAAKVLLDQLTFGPANNIAFMSFWALAIERADVIMILPRLAHDLPRVQLAAWRYWPLVAAVNYRYVPAALRPLVANFAGLLWSTFLVVSARRHAPAAAGALPAPKKAA